MSDSVRPHRRQPTRLPCPWDSPGKNTGVGCHFLLQCMKEKSESEVAQSCLTLRDPMDCSLPGSSVHGIFQARELEWGAIAFSSLSNLLKYRIDSFLSVSTCLDNLAVALLCWKILLEHKASSQIFFLWVKYFLGKQGTSKQQHFFSKLHCTRKKKVFPESASSRQSSLWWAGYSVLQLLPNKWSNLLFNHPLPFEFKAFNTKWQVNTHLRERSRCCTEETNTTL